MWTINKQRKISFVKLIIRKFIPTSISNSSIASIKHVINHQVKIILQPLWLNYLGKNLNRFQFRKVSKKVTTSKENKPQSWEIPKKRINPNRLKSKRKFYKTMRSWLKSTSEITSWMKISKNRKINTEKNISSLLNHVSVYILKVLFHSHLHTRQPISSRQVRIKNILNWTNRREFKPKRLNQIKRITVYLTKAKIIFRHFRNINLLQTFSRTRRIRKV